MNRTLIGFGLVLVFMVSVAVALVWYLALDSGSVNDQTIQNAFVSELSTVTLGTGIEAVAANEVEAYYLMGYAQAVAHPWTLSLLRQTALGRLSEWFGEPTVPIDRLTRSLSIPSGAEAAARQIGADDRRVLEAFARGISDAFETRDVMMNEHLVLFDILPEAWEDWHSVAIERLLAWLSEPPIRPAPGDTALAALQTFQQSDETLREWLHLHGFEHSTAWSMDDSTGAVIQAQFVYGATALPLFVPARLEWPTAWVNGVVLLGTPIMPFSSGPGGTHVTLLSSPRTTSNRFEAGYPDSVATQMRYERIVVESGSEHLVTIPFVDGRLFFSSGSLRSGLASTRYWGTLRWAGLEPLTDWPAWRERTLESAGVGMELDRAFRLMDGVGLQVDPNGAKRVVGGPLIQQPGPRSSVFVAMHPIGRYAARRFGALAGLGSADLVATDVTSTWAEANVATALGALEGDSTFSPAVREAVDYLINWDFRYNMASIGALIFDSWMGAYTRHTEPFPTVVIGGDSLSQVQTVARLRGALVAAVDSLVEVAGSDLARWRLETFRTGKRFYPVWSYDPLDESLPRMNPRRYAPLSIQQPGHPTTVAWESGLFDYPQNSPAHVSARATNTESMPFSFRPDYKTGTGIIARHVVAEPEDRPTPFSSTVDGARLTFRPIN